MAYQPTILNGETVFRAAKGIYDGEMTIGELLGVWAPSTASTAVVVLHVCYQVRHDGSVSSLPDQTPYAVVTNFSP